MYSVTVRSIRIEIGWLSSFRGIIFRLLRDNALGKRYKSIFLQLWFKSQRRRDTLALVSIQSNFEFLSEEDCYQFFSTCARFYASLHRYDQVI